MNTGTRALNALRRRLERDELTLLRRHVVELDAKLEASEHRAEIAEMRAHNAECVADMWCDVANARDELGQGAQQPLTIGITKDGDIVRVNA